MKCLIFTNASFINKYFFINYWFVKSGVDFAPYVKAQVKHMQTTVNLLSQPNLVSQVLGK